MIRRNPYRDYPKIDKAAYIDPTAVIIGRVKIWVSGLAVDALKEFDFPHNRCG